MKAGVQKNCGKQSERKKRGEKEISRLPYIVVLYRVAKFRVSSEYEYEYLKILSSEFESSRVGQIIVKSSTRVFSSISIQKLNFRQIFSTSTVKNNKKYVN